MSDPSRKRRRTLTLSQSIIKEKSKRKKQKSVIESYEDSDAVLRAICPTMATKFSSSFRTPKIRTEKKEEMKMKQETEMHEEMVEWSELAPVPPTVRSSKVRNGGRALVSLNEDFPELLANMSKLCDDAFGHRPRIAEVKFTRGRVPGVQKMPDVVVKEELPPDPGNWDRAIKIGKAILLNDRRFANSFGRRGDGLILTTSKIHRWGAYAHKLFNAGDVVTEYTGERISDAESDRRELWYKENLTVSTYFYRVGPDCIIDATTYSNTARFINHSCNPNCVAAIVTLDQEQRIFLFAVKPIERQEELTVDYCFPVEPDEDRIKCNCQSKYCREYLN